MAGYTYSIFSNFSSAVNTRGIVFDKDNAFAITSGGYMHINTKNGDVLFKHSSDYMPDLNLTAICKDSLGNIWIGSKRGYLYKIDTKGYNSSYTSYVSSLWGITNIFPYGKYLIITFSKSGENSANGCSIYDTERNVALQNATSFNNIPSQEFYGINVFKDSLYLGFKGGVAKLDISGDKIVTNNFLNEKIWSIDRVDSTIYSFPVQGDSIQYCPYVSCVRNDSLYYSDDSYVYFDTTVLCSLPSKILSIDKDNDRRLWFGTNENYTYSWDGVDLKQHKNKFLTMSTINRVYVAKNNKVWITPVISDNEKNTKIYKWHRGVSCYDGDDWRLFSPTNTDDFGSLGDGEEFLGVAEDPSGKMWFGLNGSPVKRYRPSNDSWIRYNISAGNSSYRFDLIDDANIKDKWCKCDAIAQDSSGNMWFTVYNYSKGCLISYNPKVYDPEKNDYKYHLSDKSSAYMPYPIALNVDILGNIFIGGKSGKLVVFKPGNNSVEDNISHRFLNVNLSRIWHMSSTPDSGTWIATGSGLYYYKLHNEKDGILIKNTYKFKNIVTCVEYENSFTYPETNNYGETLEDSTKTETILWLGTDGIGLIRARAITMTHRDGSIASSWIDSTTTFDESHGLINNKIKHMDMDRTNGHLWIATDMGLSRYNLGHSFKKVTTNTKMQVYPNPYIKSRHREIIFENLAPNSIIIIYTIDGRIVDQIVDRGSNVVKTMNQWTYMWKPGTKILPGTYFYACKFREDATDKRQKSRLGKILILP